MAKRRYHKSFAGKCLSRYYNRNHSRRLAAELEHLGERLNIDIDLPKNCSFEELVANVFYLRRKMVGLARTRGHSGGYKSHYWAWFYTTEERRKQNLAMGYNCTMPMWQYRKLDKEAGNRVYL